MFVRFFINGGQKQLARDVFETLPHIAAFFVVLLILITVSKATTGKLLTDVVECAWAFPSARIPY